MQSTPLGCRAHIVAEALAGKGSVTYETMRETVRRISQTLCDRRG